MSGTRKSFDLNEIRQKLAGSPGKHYWRSLDELADSEEFRKLLESEFPESADYVDSLSRRNFLKMMSASLALAGLSACTPQPAEKILPYVQQPEEIVPGKPLFFATAMTLSGIATGMLVESHMGRPTKIEGNPDHPASLGATDAMMQASVLSLYDPDRSQAITYLGNISSWSAFHDRLRLTIALEKQQSQPGAGLRILTETVTSPTLVDQLKELLAQLPSAKWHQYEPVNRDNMLEATRKAFGEPLQPIYDLGKANAIVALDSDFLGCGPAHLRYVRQFAQRRKIANALVRLYSIESNPTNTGAMADHRWAVRANEMPAFMHEFVTAMNGGSSKTYPWLAAVVEDLRKNSGASVVIAGEHLSPDVQTLAFAINDALANTGRTIAYTSPVESDPQNQVQSLRQLVQDMNKGLVQSLIILGGNPVFTAPADFDFAGALSKVPFRVHLSLYQDETSYLCHWHVPETHFLEAWSDARAYDGTASIVQPLIAPLYEGKSVHEIAAAMAGHPDRSAYQLVRDYWQKQRPGPEFEKFWRKSVHAGLIEGTAFPLKSVVARMSQPPETISTKGIEVQFRPDPTIYDGRFANNGWLQELPKPLTKITWDNVAWISPKTAQRMNLANEDVVEIQHNKSTVQAPVWIMPGQPEDSITVHFGYGRSRCGSLGNQVGFNAFSIRTSDSLWVAHDVSVRKTNQRYRLASTQEHHAMENRNLVRSATLQEYKSNPDFAKEMESHVSLYPDHEYDGYKWGMAIDLNACVGCNACVVACQAENNVPVVGKDQVMRGREMHWLRVDRYYEGDLENPETYHQPVPCMHCENAPCEVVCPVNATVHDSEGLNVMVYNRCVGTRYCANNCPYKVRRFNFYLYSDLKTPAHRAVQNPDVTVRTRGVMEKCTYCVQRISQARIEAKNHDRTIQEGEVVTACQQACPAEAIIFGNLNDRNSKVAKMRASNLNYGILTDLNTRPRTTYMARLKNPNPQIQDKNNND